MTSPFNYWLFGGGVLYTVLVLGIIGHEAAYCLMHLMHCISCCYDMLL